MGIPSISIDVFGKKYLTCLFLNFAADINIFTGRSIKEIESAVIGYYPDSNFPFWLNLKNTVGSQLVDSFCSTKSYETITIIAAKTVVGGEPHQAVCILPHVGDDIGRKPVSHTEGPDITIRLCKRGLLGQYIY